MTPTVVEWTYSEIAEYYRRALPRLRQRGDEWRGPCPLHQGKRDSFAINVETGRWFCHSECHRGGSLIDFEMEQSGRDFRDAIQSVREIVGRQPETVPRRKVATYTYTDEKSAPLFRVFRYFPKGFSQARVTGNGTSQPRLGDVRRVLYRLPEVLEADRVYICEGEKDADLLNRWQLVGTTNSGGAGKWRSEYAETLRGKSVAATARTRSVARIGGRDCAGD